MLTLNAILKTTKQMTSYGENGMRGTTDHLSNRVHQVLRSAIADCARANHARESFQGMN